MKVCTSCGEEKKHDEFTKKRNGLNAKCKVCTRVVSKQHYVDNKPAYIERNQRKRRYLTDMLRVLKDEPCADCGVRYPYYVMDFDHRSDKVTEVSLLVRTSVEKLMAEAAKCDVVCANCHRERTYSSP
jgi:hypothetical protein